MNTVTINDIRKFSPCYDPTKYLPKDWQGTALDILNVTDCPVEDRIWVVLRKDFFTDKELRLFAVWCARQVQHLMTDERSINAINVAEKFANGEVTEEELDAASAAARDAALDAAWDVAWAAWAAWDVASAAASARAVARAAAASARTAARAAQIEELKRILNNQN